MLSLEKVRHHYPAYWLVSHRKCLASRRANSLANLSMNSLLLHFASWPTLISFDHLHFYARLLNWHLNGRKLMKVPRLMKLLMMSTGRPVVANRLTMLCFQYDLKWCFQSRCKRKDKNFRVHKVVPEVVPSLPVVLVQRNSSGEPKLLLWFGNRNSRPVSCLTRKGLERESLSKRVVKELRRGNKS